MLIYQIQIINKYAIVPSRLLVLGLHHTLFHKYVLFDFLFLLLIPRTSIAFWYKISLKLFHLSRFQILTDLLNISNHLSIFSWPSFLLSIFFKYKINGNTILRFSLLVLGPLMKFCDQSSFPLIHFWCLLVSKIYMDIFNFSLK